jgi:hypothetical protein
MSKGGCRPERVSVSARSNGWSLSWRAAMRNPSFRFRDRADRVGQCVRGIAREMLHGNDLAEVQDQFESLHSIFVIVNRNPLDFRQCFCHGRLDCLHGDIEPCSRVAAIRHGFGEPFQIPALSFISGKLYASLEFEQYRYRIANQRENYQ